MSRQSSPDRVVDADRGRSTTEAKVAELLDQNTMADRADIREGLADLDKMTETMPGLSRAQRDRERVNPRATLAPAGHERMVRELPADDQVRLPFSSRQKKARSKSRRAVTTQMSDASYRSQRSLVTEHATWQRINDQLSSQVGDISELSKRDATIVRQVDRSIQSYEKANDRGHVVYANVKMPEYINASNIEGFCRNSFDEDTVVHFDRYTAASHQLHETSRVVSETDQARTAVFEIQTRRGAYLGGSDSQDNTGHLLPRGMQLVPVGTKQINYSTPDGQVGTRTVVQLRDITPGSSKEGNKS